MGSEDPTVTSTERAEVADTVPCEDRVDALVGTVLGHFRIDALLGEGGMGVVYRAFDLTLERAVALKLVTIDSPAARARFLREARAQARVRHENIVQVHEVDQVGSITYLVMDLVQGESLKAVISRQGPLSRARALTVARALVSALEAALALGIIHRDVKPANVLVEHDGHVRLADFGIAKLLRTGEGGDTGPPASEPPAPRSLTAPGSGIGTPAYAAPEQMRGERVDHRADMYALGVTLFEMLCGTRPPPADPQRSQAIEALGSQVSEPVSKLVASLLAHEPAKRPDSYAYVAAELERALADDSRLAARWLRCVAWLLDVTLFFVTGALIVVLAKRFGLGAAYAALPAVVQKRSVWLLCPVLMAAFEVARGKTVAKAALRLETLTVDRRGVPLVRRAARATVKSVPMLGLFVFALLSDLVPAFEKTTLWLSLLTGLLVFGPILGARRRALHDLVAGSVVVRRGKP